MALRDKLAERSYPYLQPGEQIQQVFLAQAGPSPYFSLLTYIILFWVKYRIVAVTDRSITVLTGGKFVPSKPKGLLATFPRNLVFGEQKGLWGTTEATGEKLYVHKRFHKDVAAADAALHAMYAQSQQLPEAQRQPPAAPVPMPQVDAPPLQPVAPPPAGSPAAGGWGAPS